MKWDRIDSWDQIRGKLDTRRDDHAGNHHNTTPDTGKPFDHGGRPAMPRAARAIGGLGGPALLGRRMQP